MFGHLFSAFIALCWSLRYQAEFEITCAEQKRFWSKSANLALCYYGLAPVFRLRAILGAGKAGFFCCAYDVATDWRSFDTKHFDIFEKIVCRSLPAEAAQLAIFLYHEEREGLLSNYGLSRGPIALRFVAKLIGSESFIEKRMNLDELGTILQIVDDVLDFEDDERLGEMNCLSSPRRTEFLKMLLNFSVSKVEVCFPNGRVLWKVVRTAQEKAITLLSRGTAGSNLVPPENIEKRPYSQIA